MCSFSKKKENSTCKINAMYPIRPHHGMCLAYFKGSGYSEGFTGHMGEMLRIFETNVPVKLTVSTDEICSACPNNVDGTCKDKELVDTFDREVLTRCELTENTEITFLDFAKTVQQNILKPGRRAEICGNCEWDEICRSQKSRWE